MTIKIIYNERNGHIIHIISNFFHFGAIISSLAKKIWVCKAKKKKMISFISDYSVTFTIQHDHSVNYSHNQLLFFK